MVATLLEEKNKISTLLCRRRKIQIFQSIITKPFIPKYLELIIKVPNNHGEIKKEQAKGQSFYTRSL